jgi:hypothetical protein
MRDIFAVGLRRHTAANLGAGELYYESGWEGGYFYRVSV